MRKKFYRDIFVSLDDIQKLIEKKINKQVKFTRLKNDIENDNKLSYSVFTDKDIQISELKLDIDKETEDCYFTILDENKREVSWDNIHCIIWDFELMFDKFLYLEGIKNGTLIIDEECLNEEDIEFLYELVKDKSKQTSYKEQIVIAKQIDMSKKIDDLKELTEKLIKEKE